MDRAENCGGAVGGAKLRVLSEAANAGSLGRKDRMLCWRRKGAGESVMRINTEHLDRCISTLRSAWEGLQEYEPGEMLYEIFRAACVKEFELVLEQSGGLLKRRLRPYFASNRQADGLYFNDIFRYAAKHCLIDDQACERWLEYRACRNETAHEYGERYAERTLALLPQFIADAEALVGVIEEGGGG